MYGVDRSWKNTAIRSPPSIHHLSSHLQFSPPNQFLDVRPSSRRPVVRSGLEWRPDFHIYHILLFPLHYITINTPSWWIRQLHHHHHHLADLMMMMEFPGFLSTLAAHPLDVDIQPLGQAQKTVCFTSTIHPAAQHYVHNCILKPFFTPDNWGLDNRVSPSQCPSPGPSKLKCHHCSQVTTFSCRHGQCLAIEQCNVDDEVGV